jgi:hypothetical protein
LTAPGGGSDGTGTAGPAGSVLARLQGGIEALYRVRTSLAVGGFLIDDEARRRTNPARTPREQLLVRQDDHDEHLDIGLFVASDALANLERNDPVERLDEGNFADFCVAIEGVSHFVYLALCAADDRPVSALELELQAEIDKFACCALLVAGRRDGGPRAVSDLRRRLYHDIRFADDLDADEHDRYRAANAHARSYASSLDERYVAADRVSDMLDELRWFYRLGLGDKLGHIAQVG